jgi:uncharacterized phage-associated protein
MGGLSNWVKIESQIGQLTVSVPKDMILLYKLFYDRSKCFMPSALDIARYLLHVASSDDFAPDFLCPMRLQKILYYIQGWSLATRSRPAFAEAIEAWTYGPVVKEVYHAFKEYGNSPIIHAQPAQIPNEDQDFVRRVWQHYRQFSPYQLVCMTHLEPAWRQARQGLDSTAKSNAALNLKTMQDYFESIDVSRIPGLEPERVEESFRQIARGETISLDQLVNR